MATLVVKMLGGLSLEVDGVSLPPMPSRLARSLTAYLLLARERPHRRDHLVSLFWPDLSPSRGRRRLSHTLWQIQDVLSEFEGGLDLVNATNDAVAIDPEMSVQLDVATFETQVERYRPERRGTRLHDLRALDAAVKLYHGELLAGHDDDWVMLERQRLAQLHLDALGWLVRMAKGEGAYEDALIYARRITLHEPLREDAHREVMRLCTLLGRTSEALRQFERCRAVLLDALDTTPSRETEQLAAFIVRQRDEALVEPTTTTPAQWQDLRLVGRDRERSAVIDALERTFAGGTTQVTIEGQAGVGKSRLVDQIVEDSRWRDLTVLRGGAAGSGRDTPYRSLVEALTPELTPIRVAQLRNQLDDVWRRAVSGLLPALDDGVAAPTLVGPQARERLLEAMTRLVLAIVELTPTVLILEDIQDADVETLAVVERLGARLTGHAVCIVVSCRGDEARARPAVWQTLRRLDGLTVPDRIALSALTAGDTAQLVREVLPGVVPLRLATRIHDETGGNPLFVVETLRAIVDEGHEDLDDAAALPLPSSIKDLVLSRLHRFDEVARDVVTAAAALGGAFDLPLLAAATDQGSEAGIGSSVTMLLRDGVFRTDGSEHLSFVHEQVRRVVAEETTTDAVRRRVAGALMALRPERVGEVADHLDAVGDAAPAVAAHREAAAMALRIHAHDHVRRHLLRAADLQTVVIHDVHDRVALLCDLEDVLGILGHRAEQRIVLDELVSATGGTDEASDTLVRMAWYHALGGDFDEAESVGVRALIASTTVRERGLATTAMGTAMLWRGAVDQAIEHLERAAEELDGVDEGVARAALGDARRRADEPQLAVANFERSIALARAGGDTQLEVRTLNNLATVHLSTGDHEAAATASFDGLQLSQDIGYRRGGALAQLNLARFHMVRGDTPGTLGALGEAIDTLDDLEERRMSAFARMNRASLMHHLLGADEEARRAAEETRRYFAELGDHDARAMCIETLASVALAEGDADMAASLLMDLPEGLESWTRAELLATRVDVALARGDLDGARLALADVAATTAGSRAAHARVLLAAGDFEQATEKAEAAVASLRALDEDGIDVLYTAMLVARATGADPTMHAAAAARQLEVRLGGLEEDVVAQALAVERHDDIMTTAAALRPDVRDLVLAAISAPIGRGVAASATRVVTVQLLRHDSPALRRAAVKNVVVQARAQGGDPTVDDLAGLLEVSASTIRRDLRELRKSGDSVPTRGFRAS